MRFGPQVSFTHNASGSTLAYQVVGEGDVDLVFLFGWPTHLALAWANPAFAEFFTGLASFSRLILFDPVSMGMSDRGPMGHSWEERMDDISTVLAAVGSRRAAFFGCHLGGRLALLFAATRPEQTLAVVTFAGHPATLRTDDYPWGSDPEEREQLIERIRQGALDLDRLLELVAPTDSDQASTRHWWRTFFWSATSPVESVDEITAIGPVDIRGLLPSVHVPALVLHRTGDRMANVEASRYMADRLPQGRFVELPGVDHLPFVGDRDTVLALTQEFLTGNAPPAESDRAVLTVMFTDIVDSTATAARLGDRRWQQLLAEHDEVVRAAFSRYRGREVETTGDGFLATFDGPARAIRAAAAAHTDLAEHGLSIRVGLHTGEVEVVGERIKGIAVHIAARITARAGGGETLCSRTVKDLVAGSGFRFTDRGTHRLKGVPDDWQLYAAEVAVR